MQPLNEKINILLHNNGWTKKKLADTLFVSPSTVSRWVSGDNSPPLEMIKAISKALKVPDYLLASDSYEVEDIQNFRVIGMTSDFLGSVRAVVNYRDAEHTILDAHLASNAYLHRFDNAAGVACSAIYQNGVELWWHYRVHEQRMISDWNKEHADD